MYNMTVISYELNTPTVHGGSKKAIGRTIQQFQWSRGRPGKSYGLWDDNFFLGLKHVERNMLKQQNHGCLYLNLVVGDAAFFWPRTFFWLYSMSWCKGTSTLW